MNDNEYHAHLVKSTFEKAGYIAIAYSNKIEISLSSRKVNTTEVKHILDEEYDGICFEVKNTWNGVLVTV